MQDSHLENILVVDDDELTLQALRRLLSREANVTTAECGSQALKLAQKKRYAVVLTDLMMPGMNGFELIEVLNAVSPETVCVTLTGSVTEPFPSGRPSNVFRCLEKPCPIDEVVATLHGALAESVLRTVREKCA